jgi:hypothetical protein
MFAARRGDEQGRASTPDPSPPFADANGRRGAESTAKTVNQMSPLKCIKLYDFRARVFFRPAFFRAAVFGFFGGAQIMPSSFMPSGSVKYTA